jgi:hypothetical protein
LTNAPYRWVASATDRRSSADAREKKWCSTIDGSSQWARPPMTLHVSVCAIDSSPARASDARSQCETHHREAHVQTGFIGPAFWMHWHPSTDPLLVTNAHGGVALGFATSQAFVHGTPFAALVEHVGGEGASA